MTKKHFPFSSAQEKMSLSKINTFLFLVFVSSSRAPPFFLKTKLNKKTFHLYNPLEGPSLC